jgi:response regulator of citrate/malate metabolism
MGVYLALKRYLNQKTGQCNPSYKTIARKIGVDRSTVIRYVKKLTALHLLSPTLRFKDDGSPTSLHMGVAKVPVCNLPLLYTLSP